MEIIPELVTDLPHRKALGKGFREDSFTLTLFSLHFKGQHFLWWWRCIFIDFFFFLEVKRWFLMQSEKSETWGLKNKMPPHITTKLVIKL